MTATSQQDAAIAKSFRAALLLTASEPLAEAAVMDGIYALEAGQLPGDRLELETIKSAVQTSVHSVEEGDRALSLLPAGLHGVLNLEPRLRHCFVLNVLLGLPRETCSRILYLSLSDIDEAVRNAMQALPELSVSAIASEQSSFPKPAQRKTLQRCAKSPAGWRSR